MYVDFYTAMENRGELLRRKLKEAHISPTKFSREYGWKNKTSLYRYFKRFDVPLDVFVFGVRKYGLLFSNKELPELDSEVVANLGDLVPGKNVVSIHDHNALLVELQRKYINERDLNEQLTLKVKELEQEIKGLKGGLKRVKPGKRR